jgi:superfamily II DNA or RNA helicase
MIELREYQKEAHNATVKHFRESSDYAIHDQSVGAGKTLQIAFAVKHVCDKGGHSLVLARQGDLVEQDVEDYRLIGGKASIFSASLNRKSTYYPAVFASEGTIYRALQNQFKERRFHFIAIDECHEVNHQEVSLCIDDAKKGFDIYTNKDEQGKPKYSQYAVILSHFIMLNPKVRICGYSGSPFRGSETIMGDFWKKKLSEVTTYELVNDGFLVPPVFGWGSDDDHVYHLEKFKQDKNENGGDFGGKELAAMQREILKDATKTQLIIEEVVERTKDRLGVLITCAGKKHCEEAAKHLPDGTWGIVTDDTSTKKRREILKAAKSGDIKYVLQVNCLGQGVNVPTWDTCVILRKIGSLRYLIQLIGRVLRLLKDEHVEAGMAKTDGLILDFTDTLEIAGDIYNNPITDAASAAKAKIQNKTIECPKCKTANSEFAVRCIGGDTQSNDGRCEHFFKSTMCLNCETENSPTAQNCRNCGAVMIDPNSKLVRKAYTDADYKPVRKMHYTETGTGKLCVSYELESTYKKNGMEYPEVAKEYFDVCNDDRVQRARWYKFIEQHIQGRNFRNGMARTRTVADVIRNKAMFDTPVEITHRVNDKGFSIINRKKFRTGREEKAS